MINIELQTFMLCQGIQTRPDGLFNVLGTGLPIFSVNPNSEEEFKTFILIRFYKEKTEIGKRSITVKLMNNDNEQVIKTVENTIILRPKSPGTETTIKFASNLGPGDYRFDLFLNNKHIASHPLEVVLRQNTKKG